MKPFKKPVYIARPFLPPLSEFCTGLEEIWGNRWLTNYGPVLKKYEKELANFINTENICVFNNGTLALQIGLQGMGISGEVITTPFTFVATTHALFWNKIRPLFCDIEPDYYTIDPDKIEALITPWTTAILAVHVFGYPCQLDKLEYIAHKHNLRLIYDAAHAFGVQVNRKSIAYFGDMSLFSFHATKFYHSIEGGMLTFKDKRLKQKFDYLKNFGFKNELEVVMPGTNAKMNEFQALMGIYLLKYIDKIIKKCKQIDSIYRERLSEVPGIKLCQKLPENVRYNYAYVAVEIIESEFGIGRDVLCNTLKKYNVFTRKYFYPLIPDYSCYRNVTLTDSLSIARQVSGQILTLPIYFELEIDDVHKICDLIINIQCHSRSVKSV